MICWTHWIAQVQRHKALVTNVLYLSQAHLDLVWKVSESLSPAQFNSIVKSVNDRLKWWLHKWQKGSGCELLYLFVCVPFTMKLLLSFQEGYFLKSKVEFPTSLPWDLFHPWTGHLCHYISIEQDLHLHLLKLTSWMTADKKVTKNE